MEQKTVQKKIGPVVSSVVWKQRKALSAKCTSCFIKNLLPNLQTTLHSHQLFPFLVWDESEKSHCRMETDICFSCIRMAVQHLHLMPHRIPKTKSGF